MFNQRQIDEAIIEFTNLQKGQGMNIHEAFTKALKNGVRYRRKKWSDPGYWCSPNLEIRHQTGSPLIGLHDDVAAEDWEIEEKSLLLTETQIGDALTRTFSDSMGEQWHEVTKKILLKELGF